MSRSRQFNVDGNVDIDIGVPTFNRRLTGIDIPDTRATIDMTSRVPTTSGRSETVRTTTRIDGGVSDVTGSRIDPIDNTIDGAGMAIDGSSVKTTTIKRTGSNGLVDSNSQGVITRTTTTTTRRLAEAGITGESAVSIEKQLQAIEQQLVAAAGVDRPVFAVIPMNDQANQADFNEFLRNMTNANQVNIIDRKSVSSINTDSRNNGIGVDGNSRSSITVDGGGVARDGISRVSESRSSSSSLFDSTNTVTRTSSGTGLGDSSLAGSGTGGSRTITKKTTIRRISPAGSDLGLDGFGTDFGTSSSTSVVGDIGTSMGNDIGTSFTGDIGTSMGGDIGTSFGTDGTQGGGFSTTRVETSGGMTGGSGIIDSSMTNTGLVDTSLPSSSVFATDMPVMNDVGSLPDPMLL